RVASSSTSNPAYARSSRGPGWMTMRCARSSIRKATLPSDRRSDTSRPSASTANRSQPATSLTSKPRYPSRETAAIDRLLRCLQEEFGRGAARMQLGVAEHLRRLVRVVQRVRAHRVDVAEVALHRVVEEQHPPDARIALSLLGEQSELT